MTKNEKQILKDMEKKAWKEYQWLLEKLGAEDMETQKAISRWMSLFDVLRKFNIE